MHNSVLRIAILLVMAVTFSAGFTSNTTRANTQRGQTASKSSGQQQTIEGCLLRKETAFYIQPRDGEATRVNAGGQDLATHMGQHVQLTGTMKSGDSSPSSYGPNAGSTQLLITRVDVMEATCPADIQKKIDDQKKNK
jgi:hypothetical protein